MSTIEKDAATEAAPQKSTRSPVPFFVAAFVIPLLFAILANIFFR